MSAKKRSRVLDYVVYAIVRLLVCIIQAMSFEWACGFARMLAWIAFHVNKRHRLVAVENLHKAFPGQFSDAEVERIVRRVYEHFCTIIIEFAHLPRRLHLRNYKQHIVMNDPARVLGLLLSGRPVLFVTGHFGNWEMAGYALAMFGFRSHAIARPLDNPYLDDFLRSYRERTGQKLLAKQGDFAQIQKILEGGGVLATLADQDAGQRGMFVDFFGRPASTHKAVALLALEHQVPMIVLGAPKRRGVYQLTAIDVIFPEDYAGTPNATHAITQRFTSGLEAMIRQDPEQYFWLHRRWKHEPQARGKKKPLAA
jgi:KDO2-lipid IV(A) lauroyltransferase